MYIDIEEFILHELGKSNKTPKQLVKEAYKLGFAHGSGEEYEQDQEDEVVEESLQEEEEETKDSESSSSMVEETGEEELEGMRKPFSIQPAGTPLNSSKIKNEKEEKEE